MWRHGRQFGDEHVGGFDVIGQVIPERVAADPIGLQRSYQTGRVNTGGLGLSSTPIIDARTYTDFAPPFGGDIHTRFHSFVVRQRLRDANGTAANQVIFISNPSGSGAMQTEALTRIEAWLAAIHADDAPGSAAERVIRNRPVDLSDACWTSPTTRIDEHFEYQMDGVCKGLYPSYGDTRTAAGGGLAGDTLKCQRQPLDFAAYPVTFTPDQQARLQAAFPTGVCDWSRPESTPSRRSEPGSTTGRERRQPAVFAQVIAEHAFGLPDDAFHVAVAGIGRSMPSASDLFGPMAEVPRGAVALPRPSPVRAGFHHRCR